MADEIESPALADTEATDWNTRQGLAPKAPTKHSSPEVADSWVKAVAQYLGMNISTWEIDEWCEENEHRTEILKTYFPDQYEELCGDLLAAYENAKSLRF
jgi:hypothetical protein